MEEKVGLGEKQEIKKNLQKGLKKTHFGFGRGGGILRLFL